MIGLKIVRGDWQEKHEWWLLESDISKVCGRVHKSANAIVDYVSNESHPLFGKFIVRGPMRRLPNDGVFATLKGAKACAERLLTRYEKDVQADRVSWWTMKRKGVKKK